MTETPAAKTEGPLVFIVAGEPSGDVLGARLMAAIKEKAEGRVRFAGVGGERMEAEGLESLFPLSDVSIMGYLEVLPKIPLLFARIRDTVEVARILKPDVVVTIDSPDFTLRVAERLVRNGIPRVHYVAPQVWAHRPGRVSKIAAVLDHLLALFPFEPPYFERAGLACTFVGHPIVEEGADRGDGLAFRARHGLSEDRCVIACLPGSRAGEVKRHLPAFGEALARLADARGDCAVALPTVPALAETVRRAVADWPIQTIVITDREEKYDAFAASRAALAASGTVVLELALARVPTVVAYRVNAASAWLARRMIRVPYVSLVNLILDRPVMPELLQEDCRGDKLYEALSRLIEDEPARAAQIEAEGEVARLLAGEGKGTPSERAATMVLAIAYYGARAARLRAREEEREEME